jgi:hypothetical protein
MLRALFIVSPRSATKGERGFFMVDSLGTAVQVMLCIP